MINSYLESIIDTTKVLLRKPMNLALTAMAVATINSCSKGGDDDPQVPNPNPIEQKLFAKINAEDPNASGQGYNITSKNDTIAIGNLALADNLGNITLEFTASQLSSSTSNTGKAANSIPLVRIFNEQNVVKYEFPGVSTTTDESNSEPNLTVNEDPHTMRVESNSINTVFRGYTDGKLLVEGNFIGNEIPVEEKTFYTLSTNNSGSAEPSEVTLDSINFTTSTPQLGPVQLLNQVIGRERTFIITHPQGGNGNGGSRAGVAFSVLRDGSPEEDFEIALTNVAVPDSTYTLNTRDAPRNDQLIFDDIYTPGNNVEYTVQLKSNDENPFYDDLEKTITISAGDENNETLNVQSYQDVEFEFKFRNFDAPTQLVQGYNVELFDAGSDGLPNTGDDIPISGETATSDSNGVVTLRAPKNSNVFIKGSGSGLFSVVENAISIPQDLRRDDAFQEVNYMALPTSVEGITSEVMDYIGKINSEAAISFWHPRFQELIDAAEYETTKGYKLPLSLPSVNGNTALAEVAQDHIENLMAKFGYNIEFITQFIGGPTQNVLQNYNPFLDGDRNLLSGEWHPLVTGYIGTGTFAQGKVINGIDIIFYANPFNLGTNSELLTWHETLLYLNPINNVLDNGSIYALNEQNMSLTNPDDEFNTKVSASYQKYVVDTKDENGVRLQRNLPVNITN